MNDADWRNNAHLTRLMKVCVFVTLLLAVGTLGYVLLEGWPPLDSFFMTVITLSTVGYGTVHDLSMAGRWFTSVLIFLSIISMTCWTATLTSFIVESDLGGHFVRRKIRKMIAQLKDHTVVCGSGLMAQAVIDRLMRKQMPLVVVDSNVEQLEMLRRRFRNLLLVEGKATNELTLAEANILEARHVVAALESEVDNLLVAITCKDMGHDIAVYAGCNDTSIANRMRKAGVDEVISPFQLSGDRVSELILA